MNGSATTVEILQKGDASAVALAAPDRPSLTFGDLEKHMTRVVASLNQMGIGRNDPVAIVLPNGPEMASAFVTIASGATTAPLNPAYRDEEFDFYLSDLETRLLIIDAQYDGPAREVARKRAIPVAELKWQPEAAAGLFDLEGSGVGDAAENGGLAHPDDIALVLHTSGTTSRPKMVPLSQANICASAANIVNSLDLRPADRCLNIMPLFHIHGLIAAVLSSLEAGASVYCTPGFNALRFFSWMDAARPSWYTAVPTMHQAILSRTGRNEKTIAANALRFIRSSSASLPPQIMAALEEAFNAPVVEAYGMTEAAHQMASNPLPPRARKAGTVGLAAGPEVSIMNDAGVHLAAGEIGEVVIRGINVTQGYLANPEANATAFTDGWFRTGDQGVLDDEGYLSLTGRLKEIINRGGEKISPREVDEVLLDHPAIAQAVTFAVTHDKLGEDIAAAVVLVENEGASEKDIRGFASARLADFKVPRRIVILDEIPKGPTGKLQRIGLAKKLGLE